MAENVGRLVDIWKVRNAAAESLAVIEDQVCKAIRTASRDELIGLIDTFSPALSGGPHWTRTFDPLVERLWAWRDDAIMASLAETFKTRGAPWAGVANAFSPENGARLRARLHHPAWARLPAFTIT